MRPVIDEHAWSEDGSLTVGGSFAARPSDPLEAVLLRAGSTEAHCVPVQREGERFTLTIPVAALPVFGRPQPLGDGRWELRMRFAADGEKLLSPSLADPRDPEHRFGPKLYCLATSGDGAPVITVRAALGLTEGGRVQRKLIREYYYPLLLKRRSLRDAVVFISFGGKRATDNPLGIAAELRRRGDTREHIWAVSDWSVPVPEGSRAVLRSTEAYWEALARSAYLVSNDDMPTGYQKRAGQTYLQTWHGTPLKRIGFDAGALQSVNGAKYLDHLAGDIAKWDILLSPNPFSTPILRQAFRYEGEILESGYPRNDVLAASARAASDGGALAATVRERIGLPAGKRAVLYAPTWRDNQFYGAGRYRFDMQLDLERAWQQLGDDYVILIRGHHQMADDTPGGRPGFVQNVTGYPDVSELFLVSDALITDYSSMMCDFAVTGKPILVYAYDLADYRDNLRGFYLDFEAEVPGPVLTTSDEVIAALGDLDSVAAASRARYERFAAKFCPLDDGKAGARVCDRLFGGA
jgi:CDP-glycerol glycerophosphotransferase